MKKTVVSAEEESYITESVEGIESEELREVLAKLGRSVFERCHEKE